MISCGNSFSFGGGDAMCLGGLQLEGAVRHGSGLHLFDTGPEAGFRKLRQLL